MTRVHTILLIAGIGVLLPSTAVGAVRITEVAWMGTESSYANEWIELHNVGGSAVDLTGWTLMWGETTIHLGAEEGNTKSLKSASLSADGYLLLERTDDSAVPGVTADVVYTGSLANSGETLTLENSKGNIVQTVRGGDEWSRIGGNNERKLTPQYSGNTWQTATPTPAAPLAAKTATEESAPSETESDDGTGTESASTTARGDAGTRSSGSADVREPGETFADTTIHVDAGDNRTVTAGARVSFRGRARGFEDEPLTEDGAAYTWSFGDGTRTDGKTVSHVFPYPGTYAVVLTVASGEFMGRDEITVAAAPATMEISEVTPVYIALRNTGDRAINLSDWILRRGEEVFTFPDQTKILPGAEVRFESADTGLPVIGSDVSLAYPTGRTTTEYSPSTDGQSRTTTSEENEESAAAASRDTTDTRGRVAYRDRQPEEVGSVSDTRADATPSDTKEQPVADDTPAAASSGTHSTGSDLQAAALGTGANTPGLLTWMLGATALAGLGAAAAVGLRQSGQTAEASAGSGYTISEISNE